MREPIYKGATRPAMKAGVPLMILIVVFMPILLVGTWAAILVSPWIALVVASTLIPLYGWMRWTTYKDDQRLTQFILLIKLARLNPNRGLWKTRSYSAHQSRRTR